MNAMLQRMIIRLPQHAARMRMHMVTASSLAAPHLPPTEIGARFERQCATLLRRFGCQLSVSHGSSSDEGVDLHGEWRFHRAAPAAILVQCKTWRATLSASAARDFIGAATAVAARSAPGVQGAKSPSPPIAIFMSSSAYSRAAVAVAHSALELPVILLHCVETPSGDTMPSPSPLSTKDLDTPPPELQLVGAVFNAAARTLLPHLSAARLKLPPQPGRTHTNSMQLLEYDAASGEYFRLWRDL